MKLTSLESSSDNCNFLEKKKKKYRDVLRKVALFIMLKEQHLLSC